MAPRTAATDDKKGKRATSGTTLGNTGKIGRSTRSTTNKDKVRDAAVLEVASLQQSLEELKGTREKLVARSNEEDFTREDQQELDQVSDRIRQLEIDIGKAGLDQPESMDLSSGSPDTQQSVPQRRNAQQSDAKQFGRLDNIDGSESESNGFESYDQSENAVNPTEEETYFDGCLDWVISGNFGKDTAHKLPHQVFAYREIRGNKIYAVRYGDAKRHSVRWERNIPQGNESMKIRNIGDGTKRIAEMLYNERSHNRNQTVLTRDDIKGVVTVLWEGKDSLGKQSAESINPKTKHKLMMKRWMPTFTLLIFDASHITFKGKQLPSRLHSFETRATMRRLWGSKVDQDLYEKAYKIEEEFEAWREDFLAGKVRARDFTPGRFYGSPTPDPSSQRPTPSHQPSRRSTPKSTPDLGHSQRSTPTVRFTTPAPVPQPDNSELKKQWFSDFLETYDLPPDLAKKDVPAEFRDFLVPSWRAYQNKLG